MMKNPQWKTGERNGFTLVEVLVAVSIFALIIGGAISSYLICQRIWRATSLKMQTVQAANLAMARMIYGIETNSGLRGAAGVDLNTNVCGLMSATNYPPPANSGHENYPNCSPHNGSWRLTFSNAFDGVKYIDYNKAASNMVFWPDTNSPADRRLIANYVTSAWASNMGSGVAITLTIARREGNFLASNQVSTFIKIRNK